MFSNVFGRRNFGMSLWKAGSSMAAKPFWLVLFFFFLYHFLFLFRTLLTRRRVFFQSGFLSILFSSAFITHCSPTSSSLSLFRFFFKLRRRRKKCYYYYYCVWTRCDGQVFPPARSLVSRPKGHLSLLLLPQQQPVKRQVLATFFCYVE